MWQIGFLGVPNPTAFGPVIDAMRLGLREHGYVEGRNIVIEFRWAEGRYDRLPVLAAVDELRGQDTQGREAGRFTGRAEQSVRVGHQSQDLQGLGPDHPAVRAGAGGSGDRVAS